MRELVIDRNFPQIDENVLTPDGYYSADELKSFIYATKARLDYEEELGGGRLSGTIGETVASSYGSEPFRDGSVVYLPAEGVGIFLGDIHADLESLERVVNRSRFCPRVLKGEPIYLICLGDLVNRGANSSGVMEYIMRLKCLLPKNVHILKGNHEEMVCDSQGNYSTNMNWLSGPLIRSYGYDKGLPLYRAYQDLLGTFPKMVVTGNGLVAVHGGVPHQPIEDLIDLQQNDELMKELLWNHAQDNVNDPDIITILAPETLKQRRNSLKERDQFLDAIGAEELIAGHIVYKDGFKRHKRGMSIISTGRGSSETYIPNITPWYLEVPLDIPAREIDLISCLRPVYAA